MNIVSDFGEGPEVPALLDESRRVRQLTVRCPFCNNLHFHGGGYSNSDEPVRYGGRVSDCPGTGHKAFREDCEPRRNVAGRQRCLIRHGDHYILVPAPVPE